MEIIYDMAIFVAQLIVFFLVMILAFLAYDLISTCVRRWWFGDDDGSASGKDGEDESRDELDECCEELRKQLKEIDSAEERFYKELDAMAEAQEKAEREFWERREVLVELWEPKAGDDLQC